MTPPPPNATGRSWAAAVLALAVSLLLHVGLLRLNPDLFLGGGELPVRVSRPIVPDPVRLEAITVESRRELPELLERFGLLDPVALPEEVTPTVPEPEVADLEELTPALQGGDVAPLEPIQERLTLPEPESDWMPREEVLALRDARLLEQLEISPRMLRPDTAEIAMTRDILPPVELELLPPEPAAGDWGLPGAGGEAGQQIGVILFGQGTGGQQRIGQRDPLLVAELAAIDHFGLDGAIADLGRLERELAIVQQQTVAD